MEIFLIITKEGSNTNFTSQMDTSTGSKLVLPKTPQEEGAPSSQRMTVVTFFLTCKLLLGFLYAILAQHPAIALSMSNLSKMHSIALIASNTYVFQEW